MASAFLIFFSILYSPSTPLKKKYSHSPVLSEPVSFTLNTWLSYLLLRNYTNAYLKLLVKAQGLKQKLWKQVLPVIYLLFTKSPFVPVSLFGKYVMNLLYQYIKGIIVKEILKQLVFV